MTSLCVSSPSFAPGGLIPLPNTGYGEDVSPELVLDNLHPDAVSIAIIMDDMGLPIPAYNHWVIWNIPPMALIPAHIPKGRQVGTLGGAVQGIGYGKHGYRGPKPPFKWSHIYQFNVYVLDTKLTLPDRAKKRDLIPAMEGHILQKATLSGHYH